MNTMVFGNRITMSVGRPQNEGRVTLGGHSLQCSAPAVMNGKGVGTNPEELLISAVACCYSLTLAGVLQLRKLPATEIETAVEGVVIRDGGLRFDRITVSPTIRGADSEREEDYRIAADTARDRCFIGSTVKSALNYSVGTVNLIESEPVSRVAG